MSITQEIVRIVEDARAAADASAKVGVVHLRIGALTAFSADAIRFYYKILAEGTPLEGAEIVAIEEPLLLECLSCGAQTRPDAPAFVCGSCGDARVDIVSGRDLSVVSIELKD